MPDIEIVTPDFNHSHLLSDIIEKITPALESEIYKSDLNLDIQNFYNSERNQYDAARILQHFETKIKREKAFILTSVDLYLPIFTYIFGLAKLGGNAAIVSTYRLDNTHYGLPPDDTKLTDRVIKEILHEFGHMYNLRHCENYLCVMTSSNTADDLDVKNATYCPKCSKNLPF